MNPYTTITVYDRIPHYTDITSPDTFRYDPARGWAWLQRICFWILRKLQCQAVDKHVSHTTITIDQTKIPQTVLEQIMRIRRRNQEPDFVLTGPEEFHLIRMQGAFQLEAMYRCTENRWGKSEIYGLNVRVIPDFKGCVVVPKI